MLLCFLWHKMQDMYTHLRGALRPEKDPKNSNKRSALAYALVPFILAVPPVVGWYIGRFLDDFFATSPYMMYTFVILGFAAACREFFRVIKDFGE